MMDLFVDVVDALVIVRCFSTVFNKRFNSKTLYLVEYILMVSAIFITNLFFYREEELMKFDFIVITLLMFIIIYIFYKDSIIKLVEIFVGLLLLMLAMEGITVSVLSITLNKPTSVLISNIMYKFIVMIIAKLSTFLILEIILTKYKSRRDYKIKKSLIIYIIFLFIINIVIMVSVVFIITTNNQGTQYGGYIILGLSTVNILSLLIYESILIESRKYWEIQLKNNQYEMQSKYYDEINQATVKLKSLRHDMANHLGNIKGLVVYKEYDELEEYLNKLLYNIEEIDEIIITKYPSISALLNRKYTLAEQNNVNCTINVKNIDNLYIDDVDLCIILGNLLDNAIEANLNIKNENRYIKLDVYNKENYLIIECVNSIKLSNNIYLKTTKKNKDIHGIGLKNVRDIVEKYYGKLDIECVKDYFKIKAVLYNKNL
jgi:sensor histidine kinase YesM